GAVAFAFVLVPAVVYVAVYIPFFIRNGPDVAGFVRLQWDMFSYGRHFAPGSPAASPAWSWPLLRGSIDYTQAVFYGGGLRIVAGNFVILRVLTAGNPVLWWAFLGCAPFVAWAAVRALASRRYDDPAVVVAGGYLAGWAPWLVPGRTEFAYYMLPAVPFMALAVALSVGRLAAAARGRAAPVALATGMGLAGGAAAAAAVYYPLWTAMPVAFDTFNRLKALPGVH
ncbi:MAG TPA: hypothetical protein VFH45_09050, partial [Acidimicrobiales bacterium]|nr:hypothetical protein [Acidimicrobiales bacterium]